MLGRHIYVGTLCYLTIAGFLMPSMPTYVVLSSCTISRT